MSRSEVVRALNPSRTITVVSGLPRSGTSMMMQMLEAAGFEVATDGHRAADADNPRGYYELDAVKRLRDDSSFLKSVVGHVVKVVSPLVPYLVPEFDYRVISMERELNEIMASQRAMLDRCGGDDAHPADEAALVRAYRHQLDTVKVWLAGRANVRACHVSHRRTLRSPAEVSVAVYAFLEETGAFSTMTMEPDGRDLVRARMAAVVDSRLHRQRGTA